MKLSFASSLSDFPEGDLLVLPFWQEGKKVEPVSSISRFKSFIAPVLKEKDFLAKEGEMVVLYPGKKEMFRLVLLGLGSKKECSSEQLRKSVAPLLKLCRQKGWKVMNFICPEEEEFHLPIVEGVLLANYGFTKLKHDSLKDNGASGLQTVCLMGIQKEGQKKCKRAQTIIDGVNLARDLVNGNADDITPQALAEAAMALGKENKSLKVTVLGKKEIVKAELGLLLAVNRGASQDPVLAIIEYQGNPSSKEKTAIVGKGITYDTGGLNLKPTGSMETMKDDMSGAAAVLGTMKVAAALELPVNLIGVVVSTENAIGPSSYKPGDVYRSYRGKTVEISNTDAEGRLVLADAISYVQDHFKPARIIDLATLTGGVIIALGDQVTGLFTPDDELATALQKAGETTFERVWRLPLVPEYKEVLKSTIADIKNSGDRKASSITGALFIQQFVDDKIPWAHLDIAGTAYQDKPAGYHHATHATGVGVRLLIELFSNL